MIKYKTNNRIKVIFVISLIILLFTIGIILPILFINLNPSSGLGSFFNYNLQYTSLLTISTLLYFLYSGIYFYKININSYVINITSWRFITQAFQKHDYVDIPQIKLISYSFFSRPFTLKKILMLKIRSDDNKIVTKRFKMTLISKNEISIICKLLDKIIVKYN